MIILLAIIISIGISVVGVICMILFSFILLFILACLFQLVISVFQHVQLKRKNIKYGMPKCPSEIPMGEIKKVKNMNDSAP